MRTSLDFLDTNDIALFGEENLLAFERRLDGVLRVEDLVEFLKLHIYISPRPNNSIHEEELMDSLTVRPFVSGKKK